MKNKIILNKTAFANSLAILTAVIYLIFYLISLVAPNIFAFLFNAQFFGADVASLFPKISVASFIETFVVLVIFCWIAGYVWAALYNWFARQ